MKFDLPKLTHAGNDRGLREYIAAQRADATRYLVDAVDPLQVYRAQGRIKLLEELEADLEKAKNLR